MHTLFQCVECGYKIAYPKHKQGDHSCINCKGILEFIEDGTKEELINKHYKSVLVFPMDKVNRCQNDITIKVDIGDIREVSTGLLLVDALGWSKRGNKINLNSILQSEIGTKDILIKESDLMKLIQLVTPSQKTRRIRLI